MHISRKAYYSTVFSNTFSPCGNYLISGDNYGQLSVFNITNALTIDISVDMKTPAHSFQAHAGCIYSITKTEQYLISAGSKEIHGWIWKEILHQKVRRNVILVIYVNGTVIILQIHQPFLRDSCFISSWLWGTGNPAPHIRDETLDKYRPLHDPFTKGRGRTS